MGIISWIVLGAIAGFLANLLVGGREGLIGTIIVLFVWRALRGSCRRSSAGDESADSATEARPPSQARLQRPRDDPQARNGSAPG
jgi:hypothetical protein